MPPPRVQMRRDRPWKRDWPDAVIVDRSTPYGNPYRIVPRPPGPARPGGWAVVLDDGQQPVETFDDAEHGPTDAKRHAADLAARLHRQHLEERLARHDPLLAEQLQRLKGHPLACWCPPNWPCHAHNWLTLANRP